MTQPLAIGVDLGGTQVRAALVDAGGSILRRAAVRTAAASGPAAVVAQIRDLVADVGSGACHAVGVASPGPLDSDTGTALSVPTLAGWVDVPLRRLLEDALGVRVVLENDGIAAALGEWRFGAGVGHRDIVYVTISTGIGGGVVADGRLLRGRRGMAGHVGHMSLNPEGPACPCGGRGCWEAYASGTALAGEARRRAAAAPESLLYAELPDIDGPAIVAAARRGDALALELLGREAEWLGVGVANLLHLYSPSLVILGGGIAQGFDLLHPHIAPIVARRVMPAFRDVPLVRAALGENSGVVGAAALVDTDMAASAQGS